MKPRWSLDLLRGVLLAVALHTFFGEFSLTRIGTFPFFYAAFQLWGGAELLLLLAFVSLSAFASWALLYPSRGRLQGVFILFAVNAIGSPVMAFWSLRAMANASIMTPVHHVRGFSFFGETTNIALAIAAWFLYRSEPAKIESNASASPNS